MENTPAVSHALSEGENDGEDDIRVQTYKV